jgi:hypothetical protein
MNAQPEPALVAKAFNEHHLEAILIGTRRRPCAALRYQPSISTGFFGKLPGTCRN